MFGELVHGEDPGEESTVILARLELDDGYPGQQGRYESHVRGPVSASMGQGLRCRTRNGTQPSPRLPGPMRILAGASTYQWPRAATARRLAYPRAPSDSMRTSPKIKAALLGALPDSPPRMLVLGRLG